MHPPQSADEILDARGLSCPMPLLKTKLALQQLSAGSILQVLATDSGSNQDIPAYLAQTAHALIDQQEIEGEFYFIIKKAD